MSENLSIKILKKPDVTDLAGEKVMIDFESGKYFMLTGSANNIWDLLAEGTTSAEIVVELSKIYDVDEETCVTAVIEFLRELADIGFIALDEHF